MTKNVQPVLIGLILGFLTLILAGLGGAAFGKYEDNLKEMLKSKAALVLNQEQAQKNVGGAWKEMKRAHSHAEGLSVIIIAVVLVIAFTNLVPLVKTLLSAGVGFGGLFYPVSILLESLNMPAMGEEAARESAELLVLASISSFMLCVGLTFLYLLYALTMKGRPGILKNLTKDE